MRNFNDDDFADVKEAFLRRTDIQDLSPERKEERWAEHLVKIRKFFAAVGTPIVLEGPEELEELAKGATVIDTDRIISGQKPH